MFLFFGMAIGVSFATGVVLILKAIGLEGAVGVFSLIAGCWFLISGLIGAGCLVGQLVDRDSF